MKYTKFFALAAAIMGLVACSDDKKDYNTSSEVMVEMASAELTVKENVGGSHIVARNLHLDILAGNCHRREINHRGFVLQFGNHILYGRGEG